MIRTILDYLDQSVLHFGDNIAFVDEREKATYREFARRQDICAVNLMRAMDTLGKELFRQPIAVMMGKSIDCLAVFMAIAKTGNIYVPLDAEAPPERLNKILEVVRPAFIIVEERYLTKAETLQIERSNVLLAERLLTDESETDELQAEESVIRYREKLTYIRRTLVDTDPLYIICTSGSTGMPKGVLISHRAVIDFAESASEHMGFTEREIFANQAPFYFDVSVMDIYCAIRNGACAHLLPQSLYRFPADVLRYVARHKVTTICWVPSALVMAAKLKVLDVVALSNLKNVMFCGEVMPMKQYQIWRKHLPDAVFVNLYGPSETTCVSTIFIIDREFSETEKLPIGKPMLNSAMLVLNDESRQAEIGEIGELCIRGSGIALGYYNNPEKTKECFVQNPLNSSFPELIYRTGDLVYYNQYGELEFVGRKDFQIKYHGFRIELGEIEAAASLLNEVDLCACIYDEIKECIVMFYNGQKTEMKHLKESLEKNLPQYMIPRKLVYLEEFPVNANEKVDRKRLKEMLT